MQGELDRGNGWRGEIGGGGVGGGENVLGEAI
jgi:hypothetical protein